jgi:hypothetical protein
MRRATSSAALALFLLPGGALAAPGLPEAFHGIALGANGAEVDALISGEVVASTTVVNGKYGYAPKLLIVPDPLGTRAGAQLSFAIGGVGATQAAAFAGGEVAELNLSLPAAHVVVVAAQTPAEKSAPPVFPKLSVPKTLDFDGSRGVDFGDLRYLLAHWGLAPFSPADLTGDGVVDVYDFNLLIFKIRP